MENATHAYLFNTVMDDAAAGLLAVCVRRSKTLEHISIGNTGISVHGIELLVDALVTNKSVDSLWAQSNDLGDEGAMHIARLLRANRFIRELNLFNTGLTPVGEKRLFYAMLDNISVVRLMMESTGDRPASTDGDDVRCRIHELVCRNIKITHVDRDHTPDLSASTSIACHSLTLRDLRNVFRRADQDKATAMYIYDLRL